MPKFGWKAVYEDCILKQTWETGEGNSFGEVEAKGIPLKFFVGSRFGANLQTGELLVKGKWLQITDEYGKPLKPVKLIYFRRVTQSLAMDGRVMLPTIWHFVGYEYSHGTVRLRISNDRDRYSIILG